MRTDPLSPESRKEQIAKTSIKIKKMHQDPVWHAAWKARNNESLKRRKALVDRALAALALQDASTSWQVISTVVWLTYRNSNERATWTLS